MNKINPCCLTIAGSDSGGNAGINADLRTFHDYHLHGCTILSALTAQNPFSVNAIHPVPDRFIASQFDAVLGTYHIVALKTGMLADTNAIETIAEKIAPHSDIAKVIDPVMIATSGAKLITDKAINTLKALLLPLATIITPNIPEAETLTGQTITSRHDVREAAKRLYETFGANILIKGGHAIGDLEAAEDTLFDGTTFSSFSMPWVANPASTHGTGCTLSAAIASELALSHDLKSAVAGAKKYVHSAIAASYFVGEKCGVLGFNPQHQHQTTE